MQWSLFIDAVITGSNISAMIAVMHLHVAGGLTQKASAEISSLSYGRQVRQLLAKGTSGSSAFKDISVSIVI